jgi:hypothetical protein
MVMNKKHLVAIIGFKGSQASFKTEAYKFYKSTAYTEVKTLVNYYYNCDWYFISPKHGIVHPEEKLEPYSLCSYPEEVWSPLCNSAVTNQAWINKVEYQLYLLSFKYENFITFAEKDLVKPFEILRTTNINKGKHYRSLYRFCKMMIPLAERWRLYNNELIHKSPYITK